MEVLMKMPDLSTTDSAIKLVRWLVAPGQAVKRGQSLCEIETDKAASEVESIVAGILKEVRAQPGDMVTVGQEIALFETEAAPSKATPAATAPAKGPGLFARNRAGVPAPSPAPSATPPIVLSQSQQTLGRRMAASKQNIPHFYLQASANAEPMIRRRNASSPKPVWESFFVAAIGKVLKDFERIRWRIGEKGLSVAPACDVGVAVEAQGDLFVTAIPSLPERPVEEISKDIRAGVQEIQKGTGEARGLRPAAITITNLGATAVETFAAIINPPEVAILAIGKIGPLAVVQGAQIIIQHRVALTLSADHRILNGKYAAEFLNAIIREIESF